MLSRWWQHYTWEQSWLCSWHTARTWTSSLFKVCFISTGWWWLVHALIMNINVAAFLDKGRARHKHHKHFSDQQTFSIFKERKKPNWLRFSYRELKGTGAPNPNTEAAPHRPSHRLRWFVLPPTAQAAIGRTESDLHDADYFISSLLTSLVNSTENNCNSNVASCCWHEGKVVVLALETQGTHALDWLSWRVME